MIVVVDASVAVKWFLPEPQSVYAARLLDPGYDLIAPDLLKLEVGNVLLRAVRRKQLAANDAAAALERLTSPDIECVPAGPLMERAFLIAAEHGGSTYDGVYLALAQSSGGVLVTCDVEVIKTARHARINAKLVDAF